MNLVRVLSIAVAAAFVVACSSAPSRPAAPSAPAVVNVAGDWTVTVESQMGSQDSKLALKQSGQALTGTIESPMGSSDCSGTVDGSNINFGFDFEAQGTALRIDFVGTTDGQSMKGKAVFGSFGEGTFTAKRM